MSSEQFEKEAKDLKKNGVKTRFEYNASGVISDQFDIPEGARVLVQYNFKDRFIGTLSKILEYEDLVRGKLKNVLELNFTGVIYTKEFSEETEKTKTILSSNSAYTFTFYYKEPWGRNVAELSRAELKDASGNVLPKIPLEVQSKLASYFRPAKAKIGKPDETTHEPQGLPKTYLEEGELGQKETRRKLKEKQEEQDAEALANARMSGGRRKKTKKRLSKKRRHTSRK
jgi:hypothetical protein